MGASAPVGRSYRRAVVGLFVVVAGIAVVVSSSSASPAAAATAQQVKQRECIAVADVLSDGPTTDVDPVGYAQAQVRPLEHLALSDTTLRRAVHQLDSAYKAFATTNGSPKTAVKVTAAEARVNAICPTAAP